MAIELVISIVTFELIARSYYLAARACCSLLQLVAACCSTIDPEYRIVDV